MSFPRYESYKHSCVKWLGNVPTGWRIGRVRHLFEIVKRIAGVDGYAVLSITQQGIKEKDIESGDGQLSMDYSKYQLVEVGDFAMNHMDLLTGYADLSVLSGVTSPDYRVFRIRNPEICLDRFYLYLFQMGYKNRIFFAFGQGSSQLGRWRFPTEQFKDFCVPVPPFEDQKEIASFLDGETGKIDALVVEQERLIGLLREKRQAAISHAVIKGLNRDAPLRDSHSKWLGKVPQHWGVVAARRIVRKIEQGWSPECLNRPAENDEWGVLKSGCVNRGAFNDSDNKALPPDLSPLPEYEVKSGDVLMSRASGSTDLIGSTALVTDTRPHLMLSDKVFRLHLRPEINPRYFVWLLNSRPLRSQIRQSISGAEGLANNLPQSSIKRFSMVVPPMKEQLEIAAVLDRETSKIDALTAEALGAISLLQERRIALISAAVTGKIDVRGLAVAPDKDAA